MYTCIHIRTHAVNTRVKLFKEGKIKQKEQLGKAEVYSCSWKYRIWKQKTNTTICFSIHNEGHEESCP